MSRELEIWIDPDRQEGEPCIKGTRVTVKLVLWAIEQSGSIQGALKFYPHLTEQQVKDALYYAQQKIDNLRTSVSRPLTMHAERERDIREAASINKSLYLSYALDELDAERAAHDSSEQTIREQCAKIAEYFSKTASGYGAAYESVMANKIAAAIRAAETQH